MIFVYITEFPNIQNSELSLYLSTSKKIESKINVECRFDGLVALGLKL